MRKRWLGMESLVNIQWRWLLLEMPRAKKQFFEGSPSVSSFHLPSVRNLLINHALVGLPLQLTDLPKLVRLCYSLVQMAGTRVLLTGPQGPWCSRKHWGCQRLVGIWGLYLRAHACVRDMPPANSGRPEGVKEGRGYLGMAGKVIRLPEFRSVGMPNASKS